MDDLPASIVHGLLLEWLSPEQVWTAVRASGTLRRSVLAITSSSMHGAVFRAAESEVLSDACVRWIRERTTAPLVLWTSVTTVPAHITGRTTWRQNGKLHRDDDLPAIEWIMSGSREWWKHGELHRDDDRPAITWMCGSREWYQHGKKHRDNDLPAVVDADGSREWWKHGKRHRDNDLPAIIILGDRFALYWYQNDAEVFPPLSVTEPARRFWRSRKAA